MYSKMPVLCASVFGFSLITVIRLMTYKTGKIPIVMTDKLWEKYRLKYPEEIAETRYKETSIKRASSYFILTMFSFILWVICEVIALIV